MKRTFTLVLSLFIGLVGFSQNTIFSTGFEGPGFDAGWTTGMTTNINDIPYAYPAGLITAEKWSIYGMNPGYVHSGDSSAYIGGTYTLENKYDWLMSPQFSVPANATTSVHYWMWYNSSSPSYWTWLYIMVYDVAEDTWEIGELILYEESVVLHYDEEYTFDVSPWEGKDIRVAFVKRGTYQFAMDDIRCVSIANGNDLALSAILTPNNENGCTLTANEEIKITVENTGSSVVNTFDVHYSINDGILVSETVNEVINVGETLDYTFIERADLSAFGDYTIAAEVMVENDQNASNNILTTFVESSDAEITIELMTDRFYTETSWEIVDENNTVIATNGTLRRASLHTDIICVMSNGCYTFTISDDFGDGISDGDAPGYLNVYYNGTLVGGFSADESDFGYEFTIDSIGDGCGAVNVKSPSRTKVKAWPNPVTGTLFIENTEEVQSVQVIDMLGREHTQPFETSAIGVAVDFSNYKTGLYIVKINSKNNNYNTFLIQKK